VRISAGLKLVELCSETRNYDYLHDLIYISKDNEVRISAGLKLVELCSETRDYEPLYKLEFPIDPPEIWSAVIKALRTDFLINLEDMVNKGETDRIYLYYDSAFRRSKDPSGPIEDARFLFEKLRQATRNKFRHLRDKGDYVSLLHFANFGVYDSRKIGCLMDLARDYLEDATRNAISNLVENGDFSQLQKIAYGLRTYYPRIPNFPEIHEIYQENSDIRVTKLIKECLSKNVRELAKSKIEDAAINAIKKYTNEGRYKDLYCMAAKESQLINGNWHDLSLLRESQIAPQLPEYIKEMASRSIVTAAMNVFNLAVENENIDEIYELSNGYGVPDEIKEHIARYTEELAKKHGLK